MNKICLICGTSVEQLPFGYDEEDENCVMLKLKIAEKISELTLAGITDFITDCEYGIPLWSAEIILAQKIFTPKISLKIFMPHENQAVRWASDWRKRYFNIHEKADEVIIYNDRKLCMKELCENADIFVYVGNDIAEIDNLFRNKSTEFYRINI